MTTFVPPRMSFYRPNARPFNRQMSMSLTNKGLLNPTGQNNCFLNSAVQVLWHIDVFRRSFRGFEGHSCIGKSCIFCALKVLFTQFQHSDQTAIPPDILRGAMADCYEEQHRFQLGLMDDAAECFEKMLEQIHFHLTGNEDLDSCSVQYCLSHQRFALDILEMTQCTCGATSEPLAFVQFIHYITASALISASQKYPQFQPGHAPSHVTGHTPSFGELIKLASSYGEFKECPNFAECKTMVNVQRILLNCPDVVCIGLIWDSSQPSVQYIMSVIRAIGLTLILTEAFEHVASEQCRLNEYQLTAIIAYYGKHYSTFCYHSRQKEWVYFDDAKFRKIGKEWAEVVEQCRKAHYQPLLLVYTNSFAVPIDVSKAPTEVTMLPSGGGGGARTTLPSVLEEDEDVFESNGLTNQGAASGAQRLTNQSSGQTTGFLPNQNPALLSNQITATQRQPPTHAIDPLTLSIRPMESLPRDGQFQTRWNPAQHQQIPHGQQKADDLMMFSINPAAAASARLALSSHSKPPPTASQGGKMVGLQTASISAGQQVPKQDRSDDLMMFSINPAGAQKAVTISSQYSPSQAQKLRVTRNQDSLAEDLINISTSQVRVAKIDSKYSQGEGSTRVKFDDPNLKSSHRITQSAEPPKRVWSPLTTNNPTDTSPNFPPGPPSQFHQQEPQRLNYQPQQRATIQSTQGGSFHHTVTHRADLQPPQGANFHAPHSQQYGHSWDHIPPSALKYAPLKLASDPGVQNVSQNPMVNFPPQAPPTNRPIGPNYADPRPPYPVTTRLTPSPTQFSEPNSKSASTAVFLKPSGVQGFQQSSQTSGFQYPSSMPIPHQATLVPQHPMDVSKPKSSQISSAPMPGSQQARSLPQGSSNASRLYPNLYPSLQPAWETFDHNAQPGSATNQQQKPTQPIPSRSEPAVSKHVARPHPPVSSVPIGGDLARPHPPVSSVPIGGDLARPHPPVSSVPIGGDLARPHPPPVSSVPIGGDPLYAVPDKSRFKTTSHSAAQHRTNASLTTTSSQSPNITSTHVAQSGTNPRDLRTVTDRDRQLPTTRAGVLPSIAPASKPLSSTQTKPQASPPIGGDPLYAVPDKHRTLQPRTKTQPFPASTAAIHSPSSRASTLPSKTTGTSLASNSPPIGSDPLYAVPNKPGKASKSHMTPTSRATPFSHTTRSSGASTQNVPSREVKGQMRLDVKGSGDGHSQTKQLDTPTAALPEPTRVAFVEAKTMWAKAEAATDSDSTVALMLFTQAAGLLDKILQDPVVRSNPELARQVSGRREDAMNRCKELRSLVPGGRGAQDQECVYCGKVRTLDDFLLCGPCRLRAKVGQIV